MPENDLLAENADLPDAGIRNGFGYLFRFGRIA